MREKRKGHIIYEQYYIILICIFILPQYDSIKKLIGEYMTRIKLQI